MFVPWTALTSSRPAVWAARFRLITLLWRRQNPPNEGAWALPGVFVNENESLEEAVVRGLSTKAGISDRVRTHQILTWNKPDRDPRGWVVTVAYLVLLHGSRVSLAASFSMSNNSTICVSRTGASASRSSLSAIGANFSPAR